MRIARKAFVLLLLMPLAGHAELAANAETQVASLVAAGGVGPGVARAPAGVEPRSGFERAMAGITEGLPDLVVTSTARSDADQERLRRRGYAPHRHSQHRLGLAWDLVAPPEVLELVAERAREHGFTAIPMRSPVTGRSYLHVQRYARSPLRAVTTASHDAQIDPAAGGDGALATGIADAVPEVGTDAGIETAAAPEPLVVPRPIGVTGFEFPRRLLARKARGTIVLLVELNADGNVEELRIDSSDLPAFESFVTQEVKRWKFTPFTREGQAVAATARLPIPIHIN